MATRLGYGYQGVIYFLVQNRWRISTPFNVCTLYDAGLFGGTPIFAHDNFHKTNII